MRDSRVLMTANQCIKHVLQISKDSFLYLKKKSNEKNLSQKSSLYIHAHVSIESMEYTIHKSVLHCVFFFSYID